MRSPGCSLATWFPQGCGTRSGERPGAGSVSTSRSGHLPPGKSKLRGAGGGGLPKEGRGLTSDGEAPWKNEARPSVSCSPSGSPLRRAATDRPHLQPRLPRGDNMLL